jgi:hypothetical protein
MQRLIRENKEAHIDVNQIRPLSCKGRMKLKKNSKRKS